MGRMCQGKYLVIPHAFAPHHPTRRNLCAENKGASARVCRKAADARVALVHASV